MSSSKAKRRRGNFHSTRPTDKNLIGVVQNIAAAQVNVVLLTVTFPCTITGVRWSCSCLNNHAALDAIDWGIIIVRDGAAIGVLLLADTGKFYVPETNLLAFGTGQLHGNTAGGDAVQSWEGSTKTMRKLQGGDRLIFAMKGAVAGNKNFRAVIQFFCKT